jgi:hypothetical protein
MILTDEEIMDAAFQATTHLIDDVAEKRGQQAAKGIAIGILMALVEVLDKDWGGRNVADLLDRLAEEYRKDTVN